MCQGNRFPTRDHGRPAALKVTLWGAEWTGGLLDSENSLTMDETFPIPAHQRRRRRAPLVVCVFRDLRSDGFSLL